MHRSLCNLDLRALVFREYRWITDRLVCIKTKELKKKNVQNIHINKLYDP